MQIEVFEQSLIRRFGRPDGPVIVGIHAFGDTGSVFTPLARTHLATSYAFVAGDLPGFGASPRPTWAATIAALAAYIVRLIDHVSPDRPVAVVGHSIGAAIAVDCAHKAGARVAAVGSLEGNLTTEDAFFTGQAMRYESAASFKAGLSEEIWRRAADDPIFRRYYSTMHAADAGAMFTLGRDTHDRSIDDGLGHAHVQLKIPTLYFYGPNTPVETRQFVETHGIQHRVYANAGHWPTVEIPEETAAAITPLLADSLPP